MGVYELRPHYDPTRFYPKPPYVETRKCRAFRCKNRRTTSFPWITDPPWCTDHARQVYFAVQGWESSTLQDAKRKAAKPPTNIFGAIYHWWKRKRHG